MLKLQGKINTAKVFTNDIEETAVGQVIGMLNEKITENAQVRIMPDVHAGKGSTVGTTIMFNDLKTAKISPNIVGVDIGCGIMMWQLAEKDIDLAKLDEVVNATIPSGFNVHPHGKSPREVRDKLSHLEMSIEDSTIERAVVSLGTLGGGNHYIELAQDEEENYWLSVHSGSRNLGVQVAQYWQKYAEKNGDRDHIQAVIDYYKMLGQEKEIEGIIKNLKEEVRAINKDLSFLTGDALLMYINDMEIAQEFAHRNRNTMLQLICDAMDFHVEDKFDSIHNYIDVEQGIVRKGATSARAGERLVIPLNMRDGSLICEGLGNEDWNFSAPHGAGRTMSRSKAKELISLETYQEQMKDVYSTSVMRSTLDEAPDAYKNADSIIENIKDTAKIVHHLKPVYNFKSH